MTHDHLNEIIDGARFRIDMVMRLVDLTMDGDRVASFVVAASSGDLEDCGEAAQWFAMNGVCCGYLISVEPRPSPVKDGTFGIVVRGKYSL